MPTPERLSHGVLCERAVRWLRGTKRCDPVLSGIASTEEIPDAIGWSCDGSVVVECKTSILDFYADKQKYVRYRHPNGWLYKGDGRVRRLVEAGYEQVTIPNMGDFRYFLCEPGILEAAHLKDYPDHGLLHVVKNRIKVIVEAPRRDTVNLRSELRCLRFAVVHLAENLLNAGCTLDLTEATKRFGRKGIEFPVPPTLPIVSFSEKTT